MKIFYCIMAILFLVLTCVSLANIVIEWDSCKTCENPCVAEFSSRVKSVVLTIVQAACCVPWTFLFIGALIEEKRIKKEQELRGVKYKLNMQNTIKRNR